MTSNIRYLLGDVSFYERGLRKYDAEEATGISLEELDRSAAAIVRYFEDDAKTLRVIVVEDGEETSLFNARETTHMEDVKRLVRFMFRVNEIALGFVVIYIGAVVLWSRERSMRRLAFETLAAVGLAFTVLIGVGVFFVFGFDATWDKFHEIVFPNDLWRLNPATDHMIQMFPEEFWAEATFIAGGLSLAELAVLVVLATGYLLIARSPKLELAPEGPDDASAEEAESGADLSGDGASEDEADVDTDAAVAVSSDDDTVLASEESAESRPDPDGAAVVDDAPASEVEPDASNDDTAGGSEETPEPVGSDDVEGGPVSEVEPDASDDDTTLGSEETSEPAVSEDIEVGPVSDVEPDVSNGVEDSLVSEVGLDDASEEDV